MPHYHFISGLPRSGSTLLAALLRQNPRFHAGMSSPVGTLYSGILNQLGAGSEFGPVVTTDQRRRIARGLFDSYYADQDGHDLIFDTNRMWCAHMPALMDMFPGAKVIACVRNVAWVMDSIERRYRANPFEVTRLFTDPVERNTVYSRVETLAQRNRLVGYPWTALKEAFYGEHAASLLLLDYDLLAQAPQQVMKLLYKFLDQPAFEHDFEQVSYDAPEFDEALGLHGLHKVRARVSLERRPTILPPDLFEKYSQLSFWQDQSNSRASVITAQPRTAQAPADAPAPAKTKKPRKTKQAET